MVSSAGVVTVGSRSSSLDQGLNTHVRALYFGVNRSSVKRYAKIAEEGRSLAPKKRPGPSRRWTSAPGVFSKRTSKNAPWPPSPSVASISGGLSVSRSLGLSVSESTMSRMVGRLGWSRKNTAGSGRARRVSEGGLAADGSQVGRRRPSGVRGRDGHQRFAFTALRLVARGPAPS
jgi:transposase